MIINAKDITHIQEFNERRRLEAENQLLQHKLDTEEA